jgi:hypothetical protein
MRCTLAVGGLLLSGGCAMCCGVYDNDYLATSQLLERPDPSRGRVGSVFSDPQAGLVSTAGGDRAAEPLPEQLPAPQANPGRLIEPTSPRDANGPQLQTPTRAPAKPTAGSTTRPSLSSPFQPDANPRYLPRRMAMDGAAPLQREMGETPGPIRQTGGRLGR